MISKFGIYLQAVTSVSVRPLQVTMLRTCPNMTLAVEPFAIEKYTLNI